MDNSSISLLRLLTIKSDLFLEHSVLELGPNDVVYLENCHSYNSHVFFNEPAVRACVFEENGYWIVDLGSESGTFLNKQRLSDSKCASLPRKLNHLDVVEIGTSQFEVHFYADGDFVCSECSNSLFCPAFKFDICNISGACSFGAPQEQKYQNLCKSNFICHKRKKKRQVVKNNSNPVDLNYGKYIQKRLNEQERERLKPELAEEKKSELPSKGFEILKKIGWKIGKGLGKNEQGNLHPIDVQVKKDKKGLGLT